MYVVLYSYWAVYCRICALEAYSPAGRGGGGHASKGIGYTHMHMHMHMHTHTQTHTPPELLCSKFIFSKFMVRDV